MITLRPPEMLHAVYLYRLLRANIINVRQGGQLSCLHECIGFRALTGGETRSPPESLLPSASIAAFRGKMSLTIRFRFTLCSMYHNYLNHYVKCLNHGLFSLKN